MEKVQLIFFFFFLIWKEKVGLASFHTKLHQLSAYNYTKVSLQVTASGIGSMLTSTI